MDYVPYGVTVRYQLKAESHDDEHIREIAEEVLGDVDVNVSGVWASPVADEKTGVVLEINSPVEAPIQSVSVPGGEAVEAINVWGKNFFTCNNTKPVTGIGVTVEWDAENQEFIFNGTTSSSGDLKLVNPFKIDWIAGEQYTNSVRHISGTATLGTGTASTTYAYGVFQDNAAKFIRGATYLSAFEEVYKFTANAFALDANRQYVFYFQCWRAGTVFDNYRVKVQIEPGNTATEWEKYRRVSASVSEATSLTLYKGLNFVSATPTVEISVGHIVDTKEYIDGKTGDAGISSIEELPDVVIMNAYDKDSTGYESKKFLWNGSTSDNSSYFSTNFISVEPDTDYAFFASDSIPTVRSVCEYNEGQGFISGKSHGNVTTIHTTSTTRFLRVCCYNGAEQSLTVRKGTVATGYTPANRYKIAGEEVAQDANAIDAYLPKHIYCAVGRTVELYNEQVCLQANKYHLKWHCPIGKALKRKFSVTGTTELLGEYTLKLGIYNDRLEEVWAGAATLHITDAQTDCEPYIVPVGDSLTNGKAWLPEVTNLSDGRFVFSGTYPWRLTDADGNERSGGHEGRSGFSAANYINGSVYSYGGETEPNVFWDGAKFSWAHYKEESGVGDVHGVMILLGTNGISNDNTANAGNIKKMVDTILAEDEAVKVFVANTIYRSNQNGIGVQEGNDGYAAAVGVWKYNEDKKVMDLMKKLDALLDGYERVYMVNLALTHDSEYNFGAVETPVNPRAAQIEKLPIESVHPQTQGYYQMADVIYSVITHAFKDEVLE